MESPGERMRHAEPCGHHTAPATRAAVEAGQNASPDDLEISAELVAPTANVLASVFRVFEDQRKELSMRLLGEVGAFTGFSHLDTDPPAPPVQEDETKLVVSTTIHRRTATTTTFELLVWCADGQRSPWFVRGSGVGVYPALRRRGEGRDQRTLIPAGAAR